jgi:hypothetical protein
VGAPRNPERAILHAEVQMSSATVIVSDPAHPRPPQQATMGSTATPGRQRPGKVRLTTLPERARPFIIRAHREKRLTLRGLGGLQARAAQRRLSAGKALLRACLEWHGRRRVGSAQGIKLAGPQEKEPPSGAIALAARIGLVDLSAELG